MKKVDVMLFETGPVGGQILLPGFGGLVVHGMGSSGEAEQENYGEDKRFHDVNCAMAVGTSLSRYVTGR